MPITPEELAAMWKRCNGMITGPWECIQLYADDHPYRIVKWREDTPNAYWDINCAIESPALGRFITCARADIPKLIDEVERLHQVVDCLHTVLSDIYPAIAGRAEQLLTAGEVKAGQAWLEDARKVYDALEGGNTNG